MYLYFIAGIHASEYSEKFEELFVSTTEMLTTVIHCIFIYLMVNIHAFLFCVELLYAVMFVLDAWSHNQY